MADAFGVAPAIWLGGAICLASVMATGLALPRFRAYRGTVAGDAQEAPA